MSNKQKQQTEDILDKIKDVLDKRRLKGVRLSLAPF